MLFAQLVDLLQYYEGFEINDNLGRQMTDGVVLQAYYEPFQAFQLLSFKKIPKLIDIVEAGGSRKLNGIATLVYRCIYHFSKVSCKVSFIWREKANAALTWVVSSPPLHPALKIFLRKAIEKEKEDIFEEDIEKERKLNKEKIETFKEEMKKEGNEKLAEALTQLKEHHPTPHSA
ncbi:intron-binding protein aquarius [Tanacetum coccineum]